MTMVQSRENLLTVQPQQNGWNTFQQLTQPKPSSQKGWCTKGLMHKIGSEILLTEYRHSNNSLLMEKILQGREVFILRETSKLFHGRSPDSPLYFTNRKKAAGRWGQIAFEFLPCHERLSAKPPRTRCRLQLCSPGIYLQTAPQPAGCSSKWQSSSFLLQLMDVEISQKLY